MYSNDSYTCDARAFITQRLFCLVSLCLCRCRCCCRCLRRRFCRRFSRSRCERPSDFPHRTLAAIVQMFEIMHVTSVGSRTNRLVQSVSKICVMHGHKPATEIIQTVYSHEIFRRGVGNMHTWGPPGHAPHPALTATGHSPLTPRTSLDAPTRWGVTPAAVTSRT